MKAYRMCVAGVWGFFCANRFVKEQIHFLEQVTMKAVLHFN